MNDIIIFVVTVVVLAAAFGAVALRNRYDGEGSH